MSWSIRIGIASNTLYPWPFFQVDTDPQIYLTCRFVALALSSEPLHETILTRLVPSLKGVPSFAMHAEVRRLVFSFAVFEISWASM